MATHYLFSCPCGRTIPVEPRQAGDTLSCSCGLKHQAPSMLKIRSLPAVEETEVAKPSFVWRPAHGLLLAGGLLMFITLALLALVAMQWPPRPKFRETPEQMQAQWRAYTPAQSVSFYRGFICSGLEISGSAEQEKGYEDRLIEVKIGLGLVTILGGVSLMLVGSALWLLRRRGNRKVI